MPKPTKPKKNNYSVKLIGNSELMPAVCQEIGALKVCDDGMLFATDAGSRHRKAQLSFPVKPGVWRVLSVTGDEGLGTQNHALLLVHSKAKFDDTKLTSMTPVRRGVIKAISGMAGLFLSPKSDTISEKEDASREERSAMNVFGYLATRLAGKCSNDESTRSVLTMTPGEEGVSGSLFDGRPGTARVYADVDVSKSSANVVAMVLDKRLSLV